MVDYVAEEFIRTIGIDPRIAGLGLDYQGVVSGVFLTEKPLTSYYWMPSVDSGTAAHNASAWFRIR